LQGQLEHEEDFFLFYITDSVGNTWDFEDKSSVDSYLHIGKLHVKNDIYSNEWEFTVPVVLKQYVLDRPGNKEIQLALFYDYQII
jgi:hypothetical protein